MKSDTSWIIPGRRVFCYNEHRMINSEGTIFYVDKANLYDDHNLPIQVELDVAPPYPDEGNQQKMIRFALKELTPLDDETDYTDPLDQEKQLELDLEL